MASNTSAKIISSPSSTEPLDIIPPQEESSFNLGSQEAMFVHGSIVSRRSEYMKSIGLGAGGGDGGGGGDDDGGGGDGGGGGGAGGGGGGYLPPLAEGSERSSSLESAPQFRGM